MSTPIRGGTIQPLDAPEVNTRDVTARIVPQDSDMMLHMLATAGASKAIAQRPDAWSRYAADTGILGTGYTHVPLTVDITGGIGTRWPLILAPGGEDVEPAVCEFVIGGFTHAALPFLLDDLTAIKPVNVGPLSAHRAARQHVQRSRDNALAEIRRRLDVAKATYAQTSPRDVASELVDEFGVGQLLTARAVGVTPTAVRKWRRGEAARPEHRDRLSRFAALCRLLSEVGVHDPAGWMEIPISSESTLTPIDLFAGTRGDLAVLLGAGLSEPQETLDAFDAHWRTDYAPDRDYEVVTLSDGSRSVVPTKTSGD